MQRRAEQSTVPKKKKGFYLFSKINSVLTKTVQLHFWLLQIEEKMFSCWNIP